MHLGNLLAPAPATLTAANIPAAPAPLRMPDQNDPEAAAARRRQVARTRASQGRESTDLTSANRVAPTYLNDSLGQS